MGVFLAVRQSDLCPLQGALGKLIIPCLAQDNYDMLAWYSRKTQPGKLETDTKMSVIKG
jgi:hypothetical protein